MPKPKGRPPGEWTKAEWEAGLDQYGGITPLSVATGYHANTIRKYMGLCGAKWSTSTVRGDVRRKRELIREIWGGVLQPPSAQYLRWPILDKRRREIAQRYRNARKVLVLADLHVPYQRADLIREALERDGDADLCVIAGDLLHAEAFSPFLLKVPYPFDDEWKQAQKLVGKIGEILPVVYLRANHERRLEKMLAALPAEAHRFLRDRVPNLVQLLAADMKEKHGQTQFEGIYDWWVRLGDVAICHADKYSKIHARSAVGVARWFDARRSMYPGLGVVIQGHTHHQANVRWKEYQCLETGCLCWEADYMMEGKTAGGEDDRQHLGYVVVEYTKAGVCDRNRTRYVALG